MAKIKCSECGNIFDENLNECPNCGCPASECKQMNSLNDEPVFKTTDTGYQQEETIKRYADTIWLISKAVAVLISVVTIVVSLLGIFSDFGLSLILTVIGGLMALSLLVSAILVKSVLYIYANISINIHEINMKIK